jgi:hypothetical protein
MVLLETVFNIGASCESIVYSRAFAIEDKLYSLFFFFKSFVLF